MPNMPTVHQPAVITADRRRIALYRWVYAQCAVDRGLPPRPLP